MEIAPLGKRAGTEVGSAPRARRTAHPRQSGEKLLRSVLGIALLGSLHCVLRHELSRRTTVRSLYTQYS